MPISPPCPIEQWPDEPQLDEGTHRVELRKGQNPPHEPLLPIIDALRSPEAVWITAESLGDSDPALTAHPDLPALFIFDTPLLRKLSLHPRRLTFLSECLADLALRREVHVGIGDPVELLRSINVAVTAAARTPDFALAPFDFSSRLPVAMARTHLGCTVIVQRGRRALPSSLATASLRRQQRQKRRR